MFGAQPPSLEGRVVALEADMRHQVARLGELSASVNPRLEKISDAINGLTATITTISAQRAHEAKAAERWKTAIIGVLVAVAIGLVGWLARIALIVQTAKSVGGAP